MRLIDADALISKIWELHKKTEESYDLCVDELKEVYCGIVSIIDEQPTAYDTEWWISADDRVPESSNTYIVCCKEQKLKHVTFAKFYKKLGYWELKGSRTFWKVTHWMPLPDAPTNTPNDTSTKQLYKELNYCDIT